MGHQAIVKPSGVTGVLQTLADMLTTMPKGKAFIADVDGALTKTEAVHQASLGRMLVLAIAGAIKQVAMSIWQVVAKIYSFFAVTRRSTTRLQCRRADDPQGQFPRAADGRHERHRKRWFYRRRLCIGWICVGRLRHWWLCVRW